RARPKGDPLADSRRLYALLKNAPPPLNLRSMVPLPRQSGGGCSAHNDLIGHAHGGVEEVAAVRLVGAGLRNQGDAPGLATAQRDLAAGCGAGENAGMGEELPGGEVVAVARGVDEAQRHRAAGGEADRVGAKAEAVDLDDVGGG